MIEILYNLTLARLAASLLPPPAISLLNTFPPSPIHPPRIGVEPPTFANARPQTWHPHTASSCALPPLPNTIFSNLPSNTLESTTIDHMGINKSLLLVNGQVQKCKCDKTMFVQNLLSFSESHQIFYQMYRFHNVRD